MKNSILARIVPHIPTANKVLLQARIRRELKEKVASILDRNFPDGWTWEQAIEAAFQDLIEESTRKR